MRGESVRIDGALADMLANQAYSPTLKCLLGEFAAAAVMISNNLKYEGRITLQARSDQAVSLVMVECSSERHIRGIAQGDISAEAADPMTLLSGRAAGAHGGARRRATLSGHHRSGKRLAGGVLWRSIFPRVSN